MTMKFSENSQLNTIQNELNEVAVVEASLAYAWTALNKEVLSDPEHMEDAMSKFEATCRSLDMLDQEQQKELLVGAQNHCRVLVARKASSSDGYEGITDLANFLGNRAALKALIVGIIAVNSVAPQASADSSLPTSLTPETRIEQAVVAELDALPGLPSGKADLFERVMNFTAKWEGGFVNHESDRGGATNLGVTQATYDSYRTGGGLETQDVKLITGEEAYDIYKQNYWEAVRGDELPERVALAVFDTAVNSGPTRAVKMLQNAVGVDVDGKLGPQTLDAVYNADPAEVFDAYSQARSEFYDNIVKNDSSQDVFLTGWKNRVADMIHVGTSGGFQSLFNAWVALVQENPTLGHPMRKIGDEEFVDVAV